MSMSEFERQLNNDGDAISSLHKQKHAIPADFGEEDLAFVEELNALFSPEEEELPPYFAQTLLESEDPRFYPVEPGFEKKTSVRVFRDLKLRRRLYHDPKSLLGAVTTGMRGISARRSLLAFTAAFMFIMLITVAFTAPSFAQGMAILLQGARGGVLQVHNYPNNVVHRPKHSHQHSSNAQPGPITLLAALQQLHFNMYWPAWVPRNYSLDSIYLYQAKDQSWSDGPVVELVFSLPDAGAPPKGTGEIVIREFKPSEEVLQVVQDNAVHLIQNDQYGRPQAIYVNGQWLQPTGKFLPQWAYGGRGEVIYGQNGVVFWIAGDQRDGIDQTTLWQMARSMRTMETAPFTHRTLLQFQVQQAALSDARDVFVNDLLQVYPDDSPESAYFMNLSSYQQQITAPRSMSHGN
jgi:hypothetical protein